jgi:hypothetical protein
MELGQEDTFYSVLSHGVNIKADFTIRQLGSIRGDEGLLNIQCPKGDYTINLDMPGMPANKFGLIYVAGEGLRIDLSTNHGAWRTLRPNAFGPCPGAQVTIRYYGLDGNGGTVRTIREGFEVIDGIKQGKLDLSVSGTLPAFIPAGSFVGGISAKVTAAITGPTTVDVGDGADTTRYGALSGLAATSGTVSATFDSSALGQYQASAPLVFTPIGGAFTAGEITAAVTYRIQEPYALF